MIIMERVTLQCSSSIVYILLNNKGSQAEKFDDYGMARGQATVQVIVKGIHDIRGVTGGRK